MGDPPLYPADDQLAITGAVAPAADGSGTYAAHTARALPGRSSATVAEFVAPRAITADGLQQARAPTVPAVRLVRVGV